MRDDEMESRLTRALERVPEVVVPADFAARVASKVPERARVSMAARREVGVSRVGMRVAVVAAVLLMVAMFVVARVWGGSGVVAWVELGLAVEFAGLTAWLGLRRGLVW